MEKEINLIKYTDKLTNNEIKKVRIKTNKI